MSVTFEITPADMRAFLRHAHGVAPEFRRGRWITGIVAALLALHGAIQASHHSVATAVILFVVMFGILWLAMILIGYAVSYVVMAVRPNQKGLSGILCEHTIAIDPEGVTETTAVNQGRHYWKGVYRVASTSEHIFIYIQQNQAHIIPRRCFTSPEQADLYFNTATDYYKAATQPG